MRVTKSAGWYYTILQLGRDFDPRRDGDLNFEHLVETHGLTKAVFETVTDHLAARGALLLGGRIVH